MGFQAINGESFIFFPENSRSHNMILFVAEIRKRNLSNKDIIPYIDCAINDSSVKRETIVGKFNIQSISEKPLSEKIQRFGDTKGYKKNFRKAVEKLIFKEHKDDEFAIDALIRLELLNNHESMNIGGSIEAEKEIVIILDNYKPHHNTEFKKFCELLKIKLIYLPSYTPQYNPIEQVWKSIKRLIYDPTISNREELIAIFEEEYYRIIYKKSFYEKWMEKFL